MKNSAEEKLKACEKNQYARDCIDGGYEFLDGDNTAEWWYMLEMNWNNFAWQAIFGPYLIAGSLYAAFIVLLFPKSKPTIEDAPWDDISGANIAWNVTLNIIYEQALPNLFFLSQIFTGG